MYKITVNKKTGFKNPSNCIYNIYDFRGIFFYSNDILKDKNKPFNLPEGTFYTDIILAKLPEPVKNRRIYLPYPERVIKVNKPFKFIFCDNINKATIKYGECVIYIDNSFKKKTLPEIIFMYYHELGHLYYKSENKADLYATKKMLQKGYNKSQIGFGAFKLLSDRAKNRKIEIIKNLKK